MIDRVLAQISARPWLRWPLWVLYAIVFYNAGLAATTWLVEPAAFAGGRQWLWVGAFPVLLIGFFRFNHHLGGCAGGRCAPDRSPPGYRPPPAH